MRLFIRISKLKSRKIKPAQHTTPTDLSNRPPYVNGMKILLVEDDPTLNANVKEALTAEQMLVEPVFDGLLAERMLRQGPYDCVVMDINLPGKSGYALCEQFRTYNQNTPVLLLTAFSDLDDKIKGYDCGADDYLTKPFFMRELILRIQSLTKRAGRKEETGISEKIMAGDIAIDQRQKKVWRQNTEIELTPREYQILLRLAQTPAEIVSKNDLIKEIWGGSVGFNTNTIEVYVNFLRNKIDKPFGRNTIKTKVGYGYYLDPA